MESQPDSKDRRIVSAESLERLVARLGDPRFAGSDFLWTLLLTYRYFTTGEELVTALVRSYREQRDDPDPNFDEDTLFYFPGSDDDLTDNGSVGGVQSSGSLSSSISSLSDPRAGNPGVNSPRPTDLQSPTEDFSSGSVAHSESRTSILSKFRPRAPSLAPERTLQQVSDQLCLSQSSLGLPGKSSSKVKHLFSNIRSRYRSSVTDSHADSLNDDNISIASTSSTCSTNHPGVARCSTLTLRVFNIFKQWMRNFPEDFQTYPELLVLAKEFFQDVVTNSPATDVPLAKQLLRHPILDRNTSVACMVATSKSQECIMVQEFDSLSARGLAEALTLAAHQHYCAIKASEFARRAWKRSNKEDTAPNIVSAISRCNWVSNWVATEIIRGDSPLERAELIEKFIRLATFCLEMNNFNDTLLIVYSLQSSAIKRLEKSWKQLPEKVLKMFLVVEELSDPAEKCILMRERLNSSNPPCVPYLGAFLDLIYSSDVSMPTFTSQGLVNYSKLSKIAEIVRGIMLFQQEPYTFKAEDEIEQYLKHVKVMNDDEVYALSVAKEPKASSA